MAPVVAMRPIWYPDDHAAVSFGTVPEGHAIYGRPPDAWGAYMIEPDGRFKHLFDTPHIALTTANSRFMGVRDN